MSGWANNLKLGKKKETHAAPPAVAQQPSRGTTPTPPSQPTATSGTLTIRVVAAKALSLPHGLALPSSIEKAIHAGSPVSARNARESIQRKQCWWLPYVVLAFDNNEILISALGGELQSPTWMYKAHLLMMGTAPQEAQDEHVHAFKRRTGNYAIRMHKYSTPHEGIRFRAFFAESQIGSLDFNLSSAPGDSSVLRPTPFILGINVRGGAVKSSSFQKEGIAQMLISYLLATPVQVHANGHLQHAQLTNFEIRLVPLNIQAEGFWRKMGWQKVSNEKYWRRPADSFAFDLPLCPAWHDIGSSLPARLSVDRHYQALETGKAVAASQTTTGVMSRIWNSLQP